MAGDRWTRSQNAPLSWHWDRFMGPVFSIERPFALTGSRAAAIALAAVATLAMPLCALGQGEAPEAGAIQIAGGASDTEPVVASKLIGVEIVTPQGDRIGQVDRFVSRSIDNQLLAVVTRGGVAGFGQKQIALPVSSLTLAGSDIIAAGMTVDQADAAPDWNGNPVGYANYLGNQTVQIRVAR
jgi:hypothetical protein